MLGISDAAESIGFRTMGVRTIFKKLKEEVPLPCIVHWKQNHFIVVYKIKKETVHVADPAFGLVKYALSEFLQGWLSTEGAGESKGICLLLEPTPDFYRHKDEGLKKTNFTFTCIAGNVHVGLWFSITLAEFKCHW